MGKNNIHNIETLDGTYKRIVEWYKLYAKDQYLVDFHSTSIPNRDIDIVDLDNFHDWRIDKQCKSMIKTNATSSAKRFAGEVLHHVIEHPIYLSGCLSATLKKEQLRTAIKHAELLRTTLLGMDECLRLNHLSLCGKNKMPLCDPLHYIEGIITGATVEIGEIDGKPSEHILSLKPDHNPPKQTKYNRQIGIIYHQVIKRQEPLKGRITKSSLSELIRAIYGDLELDWKNGADLRNDTFQKAVQGMWEKL